MKKPKSIFVKLILLILPIIIVTEVIVLGLAYMVTYNNSLKSSITSVERVSREIVELIGGQEPEAVKQDIYYSELLDYVCGLTGMTYAYDIIPDADSGSVEYLAIGFGDDATDEAHDTHHPGTIVSNAVHQEELDALGGKLSGNIRQEHNRYGDVLISYSPVFDSSGDKVVSVVGAEMQITEIVSAFHKTYLSIVAYILIISVVIAAVVFLVIYRRVTIPAREISRRMIGFVRDRENGSAKLPVKGSDEFAQMSSSFNTMTDEIDSYISNIAELNRQKLTQQAELDVASKLQKGLLPSDSLVNPDVVISAQMLPAKYVGGDLYDYSVTDDGRIYIAVADVSDKGISAALFMSRVITLLNRLMAEYDDPAMILGQLNDTLASQNPGSMFVTVFLAVYDPQTKELLYSNAGHNPPYILSDKLELLDGARGMAAGVFGGERYENCAVVLNEGDTVFLYTDGVNEAAAPDGSFYSTERLEEKLSGLMKSGVTDVIGGVLGSLSDFTAGASQNDDITMLTMRVCCKPEVIGLRLDSVTENFTQISEAINSLDISDDIKMKLLQSVEEIFVNICSYAYDGIGDVDVSITVKDNIEVVFKDSGKPFDPTSDIIDIGDYDHDNAVGGLGRFLAFTLADGHSYSYENGQNILKLYFDI